MQDPLNGTIRWGDPGWSSALASTTAPCLKRSFPSFEPLARLAPSFRPKPERTEIRSIEVDLIKVLQGYCTPFLEFGVGLRGTIDPKPLNQRCCSDRHSMPAEALSGVAKKALVEVSGG